MANGPLHPILARPARWIRRLGLAGSLLLASALLLAAPPAQAAQASGEGVLAQRIEHWPAWQLPAPLSRPGRADLLYPDWFLGAWQLSSSDGANTQVRFIATADGVVGDRAFNAEAIGRALLGGQLLSVANDPANPNRQIARLQGSDGRPLELESTVVGRRREQPDATELLVDELALQVLHGGGDPVVSRIETLSLFRRQADGTINAEQWQASYPSPALGLAAAAGRSDHVSLRLERVVPPGDPAS